MDTGEIMMGIVRWLVMVCALVAAAALPAGLHPAEAGQPTKVCVTFALPAVTASGAAGSAAPAQGGATPRFVPSIVPPIGTTAPVPVIRSIAPSPVAPIATPQPATTIPTLVFMTPNRATGAYVVPVTTTLPSAPGVALTRPQVLIPQPGIPGQSRSVVATGLLQSALGPAGGAGPTTPLVVCY